MVIFRGRHPSLMSSARALLKSSPFEMITLWPAATAATLVTSATVMSAVVMRFISEYLHGHGRRFPATDAQRCHAALQVTGLECMDQRHQDTRAGGADGVTERAGA